MAAPRRAAPPLAAGEAQALPQEPPTKATPPPADRHMTIPFHYPPTPHVHRHGPRGYADYASYRPWLRDEFCFRCVYCLLREQWGRVRALYAIDHFLPVALHPAKVTDYDNLLGHLGDGLQLVPITVLGQTGARAGMAIGARRPQGPLFFGRRGVRRG